MYKFDVNSPSPEPESDLHRGSYPVKSALLTLVGVSLTHDGAVDGSITTSFANVKLPNSTDLFICTVNWDICLGQSATTSNDKQRN